jgi:molecular chaperone GrpE
MNNEKYYDRDQLSGVDSRGSVGKPKLAKERLKDLNRQLHEAEQARIEIENKFIRLSTEHYNLRKRTDQEIEKMAVYTNQKLLEKLIPLVDDLERSLKSGRQASEAPGLREGIEIIYQNFMKLLEQEGIRPIEAIGEPFDYNFHEAVMQVENHDVKPGTVVEETQKGYWYKDRILRHSKVIVSK